MTVLFIWAAYVQLNDPDSGMWIGIYAVAALGSLLFALGRLPSWLFLLMGIAFLAGALFSWPETYEGVRFGERGMANINIELGRESLGLGITALIFFLYSWRAKGRKIS
ncbi:transmembrane 220 family protein [Robiginitalea sp. SC105]|nr:transmembrane 220 family protein [Robiginitalea sp. SC105]